MYEDILTFWFQELTPQQWWQADEEFDNTIKQRFLTILQQAAAGELAH